jgi:hypothetical protein
MKSNNQCHFYIKSDIGLEILAIHLLQRKIEYLI